MNNLELVKIVSTQCIFIDRKRHKIYSSPMTQEAIKVLGYFNSIPSND